MQSIVALFWRIAIFQAGPDEVPFNPFLTTLVIVVNIVVSVTAVFAFFPDPTFLLAITYSVIGMAVNALLTFGLLTLMNLRQRFVQTFTAMVGTNLIIRALQGLIFVILGVVYAEMVPLVGFAFIFWMVAIYGFIFHKALNVHQGIGVAIAFVFFLITLGITQAATPTL